MLKLALATAALAVMFNGALTLGSTAAHAEWTNPQCDVGSRGTYCVAGKPLVWADNPGEGVLLGFMIRDNIPFITIMNNDWSMPERGGLSITISVDRSTDVIREATTNKNILGIVLKPEDIAWFMEGSRLYVTMPDGRKDSYSLAGSRDAVKAVGEAYIRFTRRDGSDPFAAQQQEPRRATPATSDPFRRI